MTKTVFKTRMITIFYWFVSFFFIVNTACCAAGAAVTVIGQFLKPYAIYFACLFPSSERRAAVVVVRLAYVVVCVAAITIVCWCLFYNWANTMDSYDKEKEMVLKRIPAIVPAEVAKKVCSELEIAIGKMADKLYSPAKEIYHTCQIEKPSNEHYKF